MFAWIEPTRPRDFSEVLRDHVKYVALIDKINVKLAPQAAHCSYCGSRSSKSRCDSCGAPKTF